MKNKTELLASLKEKGVACDETMTVPVLQELATKNGIEIKKEKTPGGGTGTPGESGGGAGSEASAPAAPASAADDIEWRVRAGLSREQATEVAARQRQEDAATKAKK